jgi:hypothetical protein
MIEKYHSAKVINSLNILDESLPSDRKPMTPPPPLKKIIRRMFSYNVG